MSDDNNTISNREKIFKEFQKLKHDIDVIASFVQNDIERLIEDGYATKEEAIADLPILRMKCSDVLTSLSVNIEDMLAYLNSVLLEN